MQNENLNIRQKLNARFKKMGCQLNEFNGYHIHLPNGGVIAVVSLDQATAEAEKIEALFSEEFKNATT